MVISKGRNRHFLALHPVAALISSSRTTERQQQKFHVNASLFHSVQ